MSKNIYRVNKKTDLDEIMKNNMYKPICICFLSKSKNQDIYNNLSSTILTISKINTYSMNIIIDFDNFIDDFNGEVGYFDSIKNNTPYFMAFFKGKIIATCDNTENFIPIVANHLDQIHSTYLNKLISIFDNPNPTHNQIHQTHYQTHNQTQNKNLEQTQNSNFNNDNNQQKNINNINNDDKINNNISNEIPNEISNELENEVNDETSESEIEEQNVKVKNKTKKKSKKVSKKTSKKIFEKDIEDNQSIQSYKSNDTMEIEKQKEKLKKLKQLKELQNMLNQ
jgi:hypothetical protein